MPLVTMSFLAKAVFKGSVCIALYYDIFVMAPGFAFTAATIVVAEVRTTIEEHECGSSIVLLFLVLLLLCFHEVDFAGRVGLLVETIATNYDC